MKQTLNDLMEFDHIIQVHEDGSASDAQSSLHAPNLSDGKLDSTQWELITGGFTGQSMYIGPIMHPSEFIGGDLEEYIRSIPGIYVALVDYPSGADSEPDGWAVAWFKD